MIELKKCPFCKSEVKIIEEQVDTRTVAYNFICDECCGNTYFEYADREEAIKSWNNRPTEAEIRAKAIDEFKERMKKSCLEECWVAELWGGRKVNVLGMEILNMINEIAKELKENE